MTDSPAPPIDFADIAEAIRRTAALLRKENAKGVFSNDYVMLIARAEIAIQSMGAVPREVSNGEPTAGVAAPVSPRDCERCGLTTRGGVHACEEAARPGEVSLAKMFEVFNEGPHGLDCCNKHRIQAVLKAAGVKCAD